MTDEPDKVELATVDVAAVNRAALNELFPGLLEDGVLDANKLGELLDVPVAQVRDGRERYGLQWAGKAEAIRSLLTPSRGTLIPDSANSLDFDTAQNVFIEGDNLEVLKLLQKAYNDKVKLIYIDPPYNTGNDFVYPDNYTEGLRGYLEYTGQIDAEGNRTSASVEKTGRLHSRWLNMMYPRLVLARNLLTQDGAIFVSIDSNEVMNLRALMDGVFGPENFLNTFVWASNLKGRQISDGGAVGTHEYVLVYARNGNCVPQFRGSATRLHALMPTVYGSASYQVKSDEIGQYVTKNELYNTNSKFNELTAPTMVFRIHYHPGTGEVRVSDVDDTAEFPGFATALPHVNARPNVDWHAWRWSRAKVLSDHQDLEFVVKGDQLRVWTKIRDVDGTAMKDLVVGPSTGTGQSELAALGLARTFETPKPAALLSEFVAAVTSPGDLVMDFFAGSGSTAHAVALQNERDEGDRRFVLVNLPEPTDKNSEAHKAGFRTVSEISLARLKKVADALPGANEMGLRAMHLSTSNFDHSDVEEGQLSLGANTLSTGLPDRDAVAAEVLLREGVTLDQPWERLVVDEAEVVVSGSVAVVLSTAITDEVTDGALALKPRVLVFLEDGFAGADAVKANAFYRAKQLGITMKTV